MTVRTHLVEAYIALSFWSRTCTYIRSVCLQAAVMNHDRVRKGTCRSRGVHVACTHTYNSQGARNKIRPRTYIRAGSQTPTRAYVRPGLVYMAGSERRNCVIVFIGRQWNASCSSGGNGIRRVHWEPTGLDGTANRNEAWRTAERRKRPCVRPATVETGSCSSGGVWHTANGGNGPPTMETGSC